jgi:putative ABC transport system permease protein
MFAEIISNIFSNKVKFFLSSVGIGWGILILVVLIGVSKGLENGIFNVFKGFSINSIYVLATQTSVPYKGNPAGQQILFDMEDVDILRKNIPCILSISPEISRYQKISANNIISDYEIKGIVPEYFEMKLLKTSNGRLLNAYDEKEKRMVALIGNNVAEMFFDQDNPVGKYITIENNMFLIVGIIKSTMFNQMESRQVYLPYSVMSTSFSNSKRFSIIAFTYKKNTDYNLLKQRIREFMGRKYGFAQNDDKVFFFSSVEEQVNAFNNLFDTIKTFLWFIGISTLIGGVIGVANIMYASAKERTYEIGIRKAVGARKLEIRWMFIGESLITTFISGLIGIFLGYLILSIIGCFIEPEKMLMDKPGININTTIATLLILMFCGTMAGLRPAIYATNLNPIDSLRKENL